MMFNWTYSETVDVHADADTLWALWSDAASWHQWDGEVKWVRLDGDFVTGTKGRMQPISGLQIGFELTHVEVRKMFVSRARLPLTTLDFHHSYLEADGKGAPAQITHGVEFRGFLAPLFGLLIGRNIKKHLRPAMVALAKMAEMR